MADILSKTFLDLDGLTLYDGKLKDHLSGTADSTGSDLVSVELTLNGDHASSGNYISELAVDTSALSTELGKKAEKNIGTITVKNGTTKVADVTVDSLNDTITFVGGTNVTLAASYSNDTITVNANMDFTSLDATVSDSGTYVDVEIVETDGKLNSVELDDTKLGTAINGLTTAIENINKTLVGGVNFIGVVTTIPTSSTITVDGKSVTAKTGDIVLYKYTGDENPADPQSAQDTGLEFIYTGTAWEELGSPDKCSKMIDELESTVSGVSNRVTSLENNQVLAVRQTTSSDSCGTDLSSGKLSTAIDTTISNSDTEPGYIFPVLRDLDKKAFVHIKAIPDAKINALFA